MGRKELGIGLDPANQHHALASCSTHKHQLSAGGRLATSVCQLRHDQMEQDPTGPHAARSTFLLSSRGAGGRYY